MKSFRNTQKGFVLIALLLAMVIVVILVAVYYKKTGSSSQSAAERGKQGIEDAKQINQTQLEQQIEIQNEINSIE